MAAQVVDELVVTLTLDADNYQQAEVTIERRTASTFRKQQERARMTDRMNRDQQKRLKDVASGVRAFAGQVTAAVGIVTGLGAAVGGALTGLLGFETGLRRQAVGTALSNKQMQAWGATARRLGADASAGAEAIAALAKERQQFELTGNAPTMQALARMGVNVDRGRPLEDVLAQAQQIYRSAPEGQRQQYENTLAAQGVSSDLILMIKSERDVREAFTQSLSQATEENRKALDALADAFESIKATSVGVAATLLEALQPAIEIGAQKLSQFASDLVKFTQDVKDAGGGVNGFQKALDDTVPWLGRLLEGFRLEGKLLADTTAVITNRFKETGVAIGILVDKVLGWLNMSRAPWGSKPLVDDLRDRWNAATGTNEHQTTGQRAALALSDWWGNLVGRSRPASAANPNPQGLPRNIENDEANPSNPNPQGLPRNIENDGPPMGAGRASPQDLMSKLITQYGLNAQEAAAVVANWQAESGLKSDAFNPAGGGTGARGLAQWRGDRTKAFQSRYGVTPDKATIDQQVEFALTDPYERNLLIKSLRAGNTAAEMGRSVSQYYEAHGNVREDIRRGTEAQRLAASYAGPNSAPAGGVNIQNMTVTSNDPAAFVGGLQRLDGSQSYNTVIR